MRTRTALAVVVACAAVTGLVLLPDGPPDPTPDDRGALTAQRADAAPRQTSDGEPGEIAQPVPPGLQLRPRVTRDRSWRVARGVRYRRFDTIDRRGRYRTHVLAVDLRRRGVRIDRASPATVPARGPLTRLLRRDDAAVAGVNGGFFDIDDTGAPLGVGRDRQLGFLHAAKYTWRNAFTVRTDGTLRIGPVAFTASIEQHPDIEITNVNSPRVREGKVGVWTRSWGRTSGYSVTDGQRRDVRMVRIEKGRVVSRSRRLTSGEPIRGAVLVGRGPGAAQLAALRVGDRATVTTQLPRTYAVAVGGERMLLKRGRLLRSDDVYLHPRTAIGIDQSRRRVLLVAVDGRSDRSRGLTLDELGRLMRRLGADVALNLDGGGSTTLAARGPGGRLGVRNLPSDGTQRRIPDGVAVLVR